jgi:hypothetical protein
VQRKLAGFVNTTKAKALQHCAGCTATCHNLTRRLAVVHSHLECYCNCTLITTSFIVPVQAQLAENEAQLADAQKAAASAHADAQAARAALAAAQQEQRGDVAALRQQLEADMEKVRRQLCVVCSCPPLSPHCSSPWRVSE